jgi:GT2 family glycosyltransferase
LPSSARHAPIGLIVKTWNTGEVTRLCLDAVVGALILPSEITIVDLGNDLETRVCATALAERLGISLHWLAVGHRVAPGVANRQAFETLSAPFVGLLDNDVIVPRHWLDPIMAILREPSVGMVAPIRPDPFLACPDRDDSTEAALDDLKSRLDSIPEVIAAFTGGRSLEEFGREVQWANDLPREATIGFPSALSSCCLAMSRAAIDAAGGIADPAFSDGYGSEDIDLSWRMLEAGYQAVRTSEVFVVHLRHTSLVANQVDFAAELSSANRLLYARWRKQLLGWGRDRLRRGDDRDALSQRFIIRELFRNTTFASELFLGEPKIT